MKAFGYLSRWVPAVAVGTIQTIQASMSANQPAENKQIPAGIEDAVSGGKNCPASPKNTLGMLPFAPISCWFQRQVPVTPQQALSRWAEAMKQKNPTETQSVEAVVKEIKACILDPDYPVDLKLNAQRLLWLEELPDCLTICNNFDVSGCPNLKVVRNLEIMGNANFSNCGELITVINVQITGNANFSNCPELEDISSVKIRGIRT